MHLAVICQCVRFTCVPCLSTWYVAPVKAVGCTCPLYFTVALENLKAERWAGCRKGSYVANLDEMVTLLPFGQATVSGQLVMRPPQANPVQPTSIGAVIWITILYGTRDAIVEGRAMPNAMPWAVFVVYLARYWLKTKPVSLSW
jgi:hypothetical protein